AVVYASWRAPESLRAPDVTPLRPRGFDGADGVRYAAAPFGRAGLVLLATRGGEPGAGESLPVPGFHVTEIDRLAQLVRASALVLGARLDQLSQATSGSSSRSVSWPVNAGSRLATALDS